MAWTERARKNKNKVRKWTGSQHSGTVNTTFYKVLFGGNWTFLNLSNFHQPMLVTKLSPFKVVF